MPVVIGKNDLLHKKLRDDGVDVATEERTAKQPVDGLHIGILNLMPDAALRATERQFIKPMASGGEMRQVNVRIHLFTLQGVERSQEARDYINRCYERFEDIKPKGLDGLIITGAPPLKDNILEEAYASALDDVVDWASETVLSTWFSCLSVQYVAKRWLGIDRTRMRSKLWGVYSHKVCATSHPLVRNIAARFNCVHSRYYDVDAESIEHKGFIVLARCEANEQFLLAASADGLKTVLCQGHPEYDTISLLKEYKREVDAFLAGKRPDYPPSPASYFDEETERNLAVCRDRLLNASGSGSSACVLSAVSEDSIANTWAETSGELFGNWLRLIYQAKVDKVAGVNFHCA